MCVAQNILNMQVTPQELAQYTNLYNTCANRLPIEPLLRAVVECDPTSQCESNRVPSALTFVVESGDCTTTNGATCLRSPNFDGADQQCASPALAENVAAN